MSDVAIVVGIKGDTSGGRVIKRELDEIGRAGDKAINSTERLKNSIGALGSAANILRSGLIGLGAAIGIREVIQAADQYTVLEARLRSVARTTGETSRMMAELRRISNDTGSEMATSISILQRLSFVREELKATNNQMLQFTETVTKLGVTSGALPEAMKAGLTQLGQALSSQYTRAEEFNSIMENIPAVGKAIADELGVTTGQLRLLVVEGKLLSSDVFAAILNQTQKVRAEFEEFPKTAAQGFKQMLNSFDQVIAQANKTTGATNGIGIVLRGVGESAKAIYDGLGTAFDFLAAGIQEGVNLIDIALNRVKQTINDISRFIPGYGGTNFQIAATTDPGSIFAAANAARKEREKNLFGDAFATGAATSTKSISQDYAKIASGLSGDPDKAKKALREQKELQDKLTNAIKESRTEEEQLYDKIAEMERLRPFAKTNEQAQAIAKNIRNANDELDQLRIKAELNSPMGKAFKAIAEEIQDGFKDAFKGAFEGGGSMFKKFTDGVRATFKSLLLDLAYQAAVRPIVISMIAAGAGMFGISSGAQASVLGTGGGGGVGLSSISSLSGLLNGGLYSGSLAGVGTGIGNVLSGQAYGTFGPFAPGSLQSTLGGAFGNLGYGALGGLGASLLGLGNKNGLVNLATGTLGSLAGGAIGTSMGTILGMAGGPVGAIAGGFLGTALGGLFGGGKPSDMAQGGLMNLGTGARTLDGQTGKKFSQANADFRNALFDEVAKLTELLRSVGATVQGTIGVVVGSRDGLRLKNAGHHVTANFGNNSQAFTAAVMQQVVAGTTGLNETFTKILNVIGVGDLNKLAEGFAFGQWFENLGKVADPLADVMKELNAQFDGLRAMATSLGFPLEKINAEYEKQAGNLKAQVAGFANLDAMGKAFNNFLNGQAMSEASSLSPIGKLKLAQETFGGLLSKAQGGDLSVTQDLLGAADQLLSVGRNVYASSTSFAGLESFVRSSVSGVARSAGVPGFEESPIVSMANNVYQTNMELIEQVKVMQDELTKMRKVMESWRNQMAAA